MGRLGIRNERSNAAVLVHLWSPELRVGPEADRRPKRFDRSVPVLEITACVVIESCRLAAPQIVDGCAEEHEFVWVRFEDERVAHPDFWERLCQASRVLCWGLLRLPLPARLLDMSFLIELLFGATQVGIEGVADVVSDAQARKNFDENRVVRCGIRAVKGRVANIGTEWSYGDAAVSPGHITFTPTMGVVGVRELEGIEIDRASIRKPKWREKSTADSRLVTITCGGGELVLELRTGVFDEVLKVLEARESI
jgi:hypothetical protein